ncbi:hypothetical protein R5R35_013740 [Gryllus longicercus]|uniref:tRNA wybutosine-synthesizing protein 3 homolog n=1 Tax=Gryllus longicercus TaxID=2509291 RepID=A0AAN9ZCM9_9ORTH
MNQKCTASEFCNIKKQVLQSVDFSRKGSIDDAILNLVEEINDREEFFTTSSCSGRVILYCESSQKQKHLCQWLFVSHDPITEEALIKELDPLRGDIILKFEPLILHVQCFSLDYAKKLHTCALESGFRNSGITLGKHKKITLAVRSCLQLEVPISDAGKLLVSDEYVRFLTKKINEKMDENRKRTKIFFEKFQCMFSR